MITDEDLKPLADLILKLALDMGITPREAAVLIQRKLAEIE